MTVLSGYIFKLGQKGLMKFYKKRWFVVPENQDIIYYYESKLDMKLYGQISIKDILHVCASKNESFNKGSTWGFELTTPGRVYYLYASTEHDRIYWIEGVTARMNQIKKKDEETKQKTFGIINDLKVWRKNGPNSPGGGGGGSNNVKGTDDDLMNYNNNDEEYDYMDDDQQQPDKNNNSQQLQQGGFQPKVITERMKLEREIENKENLISKLQEEKIAFEQYAKELEEEKQQLQKENEKILEQLDQSNIDQLFNTIKDLETEKEELLQDMEAVQNELVEEKEFREQILKEKKTLEKNFGLEKSQLLHMAEESESGKKKAIQLMQSNTNISTSGFNKTNTSGSKNEIKESLVMYIYQLERSSNRYRKSKDSYFHENIKLKKSIDENSRALEREKPLASFEETLNQLNSKTLETEKSKLPTFIPLVNLEINQLLEFIGGSGQISIQQNDLKLNEFIGDEYKPEGADVDVDLSSDIVTEDESISEIKIKMKSPISQISKEIQLIHSELAEINSSAEVKNLKDQLKEMFEHLGLSKNVISEFLEGLKIISKETSDLQLYQDSMDPLESNLDLFMNRIEPIVESNSSNLEGIDQEEFESLQLKFKEMTQYYTEEQKKSVQWIQNIDQIVSKLSETITEITLEIKEPIKELTESLQSLLFEKHSTLTERFKKVCYEIISIKKKLILLKNLEEIQSKQHSNSNGSMIDYVAKQEDQLDVLVESAIHSFSKLNSSGGSVIPPNFERLGEGLYQFGTKRINTTILAGQLMVRVGGGFMTFEEFVLKYGRIETIKILRTPSKAQLKKQQSYQDPMPFRPTSRATVGRL